MKWTTSPNLNDGCPVKTTQGMVNSLLNDASLILEKCLIRPVFTKYAWGNGSKKI